MVWRKKKKKKEDEEHDPFGFDEMDADFNKVFNELEKQMPRMIKELEKMFTTGMMAPQKKDKSMVYGFSIKMGPEGMHFDDFGNIKPEQRKISKEREPLTDIIKTDKGYKIIIELPGVSKKDIKTTVKSKTLTISVPDKFQKTINLPEPVKTKPTKTTYKNGVLEIDLSYRKRK